MKQELEQWRERCVLLNEIRHQLAEASAVFGAMSQGHEVSRTRLKEVRDFLRLDWDSDTFGEYPRMMDKTDG